MFKSNVSAVKSPVSRPTVWLVLAMSTLMFVFFANAAMAESSFDGTFAGTATQDERPNGTVSSANVRCTLKQNENTVTGSLGWDEGLYLNASTCGIKTDILPATVNFTGTVGADGELMIHTTIIFPDHEQPITIHASIKGDTLTAKAMPVLPPACGRGHALKATLTRQEAVISEE